MVKDKGVKRLLKKINEDMKWIKTY